MLVVGETERSYLLLELIVRCDPLAVPFMTLLFRGMCNYGYIYLRNSFGLATKGDPLNRGLY